MGASAPPPPNYTAAAEATGENARLVTEQQTWANRPDQINPFGQITYDAQPVYDPTTGENLNRWTQTQTLTPEAQRALDAQLDLQGSRSELASGMINRIGSEVGAPIDWDRFGDIQGPVAAEGIDFDSLPEGVGSLTPTEYQDYQLGTDLNFDDAYGVGSPTAFYDEAGDALFERSKSRLDPRFAQARNDLDVQLRSQGLAPGDEAYDRAVGNLDRAETDAYQAADLEATQFAGQEGSRMLSDAIRRRGVDTTEATDIANFENQAIGSQAGIDLARGGAEFDERAAAGGFQNEARDQALREQLAVKDRAYTQANQNVQDFNNIRNSAIQEEMLRRGFSLNEANALISGQQVSLPNFNPVNLASKADGIDYLGAATAQYQSEIDRVNASNAGLGGLLGGVGSLAGGVAGFF